MKPTAPANCGVMLSLLWSLSAVTCGTALTDEGSVDGPLEREAASANLIDYEPIPLSRMVGIAKLAVIGDVAAVRQDTYEFRVSADT